MSIMRCVQGLAHRLGLTVTPPESSEHKKGETNGKSGTGGKESFDGSESEEDRWNNRNLRGNRDNSRNNTKENHSWGMRAHALLRRIRRNRNNRSSHDMKMEILLEPASKKSVTS
ncbi:hypothetical protein Tco_1323313 [Tanacetum coccineum]